MKPTFFYIYLGCLFHCLSVFCEYTPAYYHDKTIQKDQGSWMAELDNSTLLRRISMAGTHDTMALYGGDITQCQTLSLSDQLRSGIRALDIRCRCVGNNFKIHHGIAFQFASFDDVLNTVTSFLNERPSETILMRVGEAYEPDNCQVNFNYVFEHYYWNNTKYSDYFMKSSKNDLTLGETRGKIVLLVDFHTSKIYGLPYSSFANIQDDYNLVNDWQLYKKWTTIKEQLSKASFNSKSESFYMNYLSGSGGSLPFFVVSGHSSPGTSAPRLWTGLYDLFHTQTYPDFPRINGMIFFEGTNVLTYNYIWNHKLGFVGIIMIDFPGYGLIEEIIQCNNSTKSIH